MHLWHSVHVCPSIQVCVRRGEGRGDGPSKLALRDTSVMITYRCTNAVEAYMVALTLILEVHLLSITQLLQVCKQLTKTSETICPALKYLLNKRNSSITYRCVCVCVVCVCVCGVCV